MYVAGSLASHVVAVEPAAAGGPGLAVYPLPASKARVTADPADSAVSAAAR